MGAFDFVEKPLSLEKTVLVVRNALRQRRLEAENRALRARVDRPQTMVGESFAMRRLREQVAMAAPTNGRVLIYGENGTGKELVARTVHAMSHRKAATFVEVNCAAIPEELIESELFGHVRGAFTGAVSDRRGKFETADGGTIFLDEIGDMSLKTQAKVLRVLQEQTLEAVGGTSRIRVDARVLAATNKVCRPRNRAGNFREDLYFRLNVIPIFVPPLRERQEDVPLLANHFMAEYAREYGRRPKQFDADAIAVLQESAGQATCANCATSSNGSSSWCRAIRSPWPTWASSSWSAWRVRRPSSRAEDSGRHCTKRANASNVISSSERWPSNRGICHERPKSLASSAATCTARCARSASRRRGAPTRRRFSRRLIESTLRA